MRIDKVKIKKFKNLQDFEIDIDENQWENVFLGQNATGKSNFFEALVLIFKHLDIKLKDPPPFEFNIYYTCRGKRINVFVKDNKYHFTTWQPGKLKDQKIFWTNLQELSKAEFERRKEDLLPKNVFIYYSGTSQRLQNVYIEHQRNYYLEIIKKESKNRRIDTLRRIFLVQNIHSKFALLSFFIFGNEQEKILEFLNKELGIVDFYSLLLVLKQPVWSHIKSDKEMFWNAGGLVRSFLEQLWDFSVAPIYSTESVPVSYKKSETQERLYLFLSDKSKLEALAKKYYKTNIQFFNAFESAYISDLIDEVKVRVKKKNSTEHIPFTEMSEGEQQLLTVLGMLRFLKDEESLILLDEPDTHLNPIWKWKYLDYFKTIVGRENSTQIFISTHDPLVIGGLSKEQIRVFRCDETGKITTHQPEIDPKGLGVAGILTSELFGLPTTLDMPTQRLLNRRNKLLAKSQKATFTEKERKELNDIFLILNQDKGISSTYRDPLYQTFIKLIGDKDEFQITEKTTPTQLKRQNKIALKILEKIAAEEKRK